MKCSNSLCYCPGSDTDSKSKAGCCDYLTEGGSILCCGYLKWKKAMLVIALVDLLCIAAEAYGTSGATLGEVETRLGISHFFNITLEMDETSSIGSEYYIIYMMGILLAILRFISIFSLVLGSQNYRPCNVLFWIICAPVGWAIFFIMQIVLLMRYSGEDNQMSKFWVMWNDHGLLSESREEMKESIANWEPNSSSFGQPCINILITSIVTFFYTLISTFYVTAFYCKQTTNQIH